jgi:hypothetical protein
MYEVGVLYVVLISASYIKMTVGGIYTAGTLEYERHSNRWDTIWLAYE